MGRLLLVLPVFACACGPSVDDLVEQLAGGADQREWARQELLLAKDRAVEPLLRALEDQANTAGRPALVAVLVSLMMRVEDGRISAALTDHLANDPQVTVRSRIARLLGMHARAEAIPALLGSLEDAEGDVRHQAMLALSSLDGKMTPAQREGLEERAHELVDDEHPGVQLEAQIRIEAGVGKWIQEAGQLMLKAQVAAAESLYATALARAPRSKRAQYRAARFHYDNGDRPKGLQLLRQYGMLLDVPLLDSEPEVDGELGDATWRRAARVDSFFQLSMGHNAALRSELGTELYVAYTPEALLLGFYGHDDHPDSLVVKIKPGDEAEVGGVRTSIWTDDIIELFIDADFDHKTYSHAGINSLGVVSEEWIRGNRMQMRSREEWEEEGWSSGAQLATHVGADHWSIEYRLPFDDERFPRPGSGSVWGFNMVRVFRGEEYSQWVRTYSGGHSPDDFGVLFFN